MKKYVAWLQGLLVVALMVAVVGGLIWASASIQSPKDYQWTLVTRDLVEFGVDGGGRYKYRWGWFVRGYYSGVVACTNAGVDATAHRPGPEENQWRCVRQGEIPEEK